MKKITLIVFLLFTTFASTQNRMMTAKNGQITFEASVPYFEPIKADNNKVRVAFDPKTQVLECVALVADYDFELDLMKAHFNENYLESGRYPKATFRGKVENFDLKKIDAEPKEHLVKGKLQLHGRSKMITAKIYIKRTVKGIEMTSNFVLNPTDFKIEIPSTVAGKIAKKVNTNLVVTLQ